MPGTYFEDATITIKETLTKKKYLRTVPYSGPAKLSFYKNAEASPFFTSTVNVVEGNLDKDFKHKMPAVAKTEEYYDLRVSCEYKKVNKGLLTATIWPKTAQVLFQDQGKQPVKALNFLVKQRGVDDQRLTTDGQGKCSFMLLARAPYSIVPQGKWAILTDEQVTAGQFRDHKITLEKVINAKFVAPDTSQAPYEADADNGGAFKQWVNLKSKEKDHEMGCGCDARSNFVVFSVEANPPENGEAGDKVYFEVTFGKESKRDTPAPSLSAEWPVHKKKAETKKVTGYVILAPVAEGNRGFFEVDLGIAGGDTCTVKIGGTPEVAEDEIKLINWRKIYAQVTKSSTLATPSLATAIKCLKEVFIDLEDATADMVTVDVSSAPAGSIVNGPTLINAKLPASSLIVGDHNIDLFTVKLKARFASEKLPVAHVIYCDEQIDAKTADLDTTTAVAGTIDFPGGGNVPGIVIAGSTIDKKCMFLAKDLKDGTDSVKACSWKEVGGSGTGVITSADYKIDYVKNGNAFYVRLPDAAKTLYDAGKGIEVSYKVAWAKGPFAGWCTNGNRHIVVKTGRPDRQICGTLIHEIGHAINQSAKKGDPYPGLPKPPHERFYTNNRGHYGPHCADGVDQDYYDDVTKRMDVAAAQSKVKCIMYGSTVIITSVDANAIEFCAKCAPYAKAAAVVTVST